MKPSVVRSVALAATLLAAAAAPAVDNPTIALPPPGLHGFPLWDSWFELGPFGYTEQEYFVSGTAVTTAGTNPQPFRTRVIVTRPIDAADFNGSLMMDWVNVTAQFENAVDTVAAHDYLMREGWAFVHVSAQAVGICCNSPFALQVWDNPRYGTLDHPGDDYAASMFAQIAQALRDPHAVNPTEIDMMDGLVVERIVAAGQSQSAAQLETYLTNAQGGVAGNVVDAFLIHGRVGGAHVAISNAAAAKTTPVLQLSSDFEAHEPDPVPNDYYALWEVAGAAHADFWIGVHSEEGHGPRLATGEKAPATADHDLHVGNPPYTATLNYGEQVDPGQPVCILQGSQFPMHAAVKAALEAIDRWLRTGAKPPSSPRYEFDNGALALDQHGNALGGIRYAQVEHPVAHYISTNCALGGSTVPFTDAEIIALYSTHAEYACQMKATLSQNVKDGFMLREEGEALLERMEAATNRWGPLLEGVDDCDIDGIPDDADNCPLVTNASQLDRGGIDTSVPDGIGDACQCGDVSGNGIVNGQDGNAMRRHGIELLPNPLYKNPQLCDVSGSGTCNGQDGNLTRGVALGHASSFEIFGQHCEAADRFSPVCSDCGDPATGTTHYIEEGDEEQAAALAAIFSAVAGDTIEFGPGTFEFDTTLVMAHKQDIRIVGQGRDQTILDFHGSFTPEGISVSHMTGIWIEDMTVWDTPGFSIKVSDSDHVVIRNVTTGWSSADTNPNDAVDDRGGMDPKIPSTLAVSCEHALSYPVSTGFYTDKDGVQRTYVTDSSNGGYAIYPVLSNDVLIENVLAVGSSDAGIYVGQSNDVIVRNSEALFNVAGFEIENTDNADVYENIAHCNTGGFLTFDLPGLNQYGERTRTYDNYSGYNNTDNFAPGGIVSVLPMGIGILQLGYDFHEIFGNTVEFNRTVGAVYVSHELVDGNTNNPDTRMDLYPEGLYLHDNVFTTNGRDPEPPDEGVIVCADDTGPGFTPPIPPDPEWAPCEPTDFDDSHPSLLPALIQIKGALAGDGYGPTGAHVVWDGMLDLTSNGCAIDPTVLAEGRIDSDGKPIYDGGDTPACRYNDYKFTNPLDPGSRKYPEYWSCIADEGDAGGNTFSIDSRKFLNFKNTDPTDPPLLDIDAHDCQQVALPPAVVEPYIPGVGGDPPPTQAEIDAICADYSGSAINRDALPYNCTWLSQYNLFSDSTDPRSGAHEGGILFDLTTPLFSDYAKKYRILFLPPGEQASWHQGSISEPNATLDFPVGTVIAKTFSFPDEVAGEEDVVETRLLIHRATNDGGSLWEGMAYHWQTDGAGNRTDALLKVEGINVPVSWNYSDPDPDVSATYVGSTPNYSVPHANQCGNCHINDDRTPGDAPIGPKVRLLNRPMDYGSGPENQLQHWIDAGILSGAPALAIDANEIATNVHRAPRFNVDLPGGDAANIPASEPDRLALMTADEIDEELRTRAWFESNCAHCHNRDGLAQSTGVWFDMFRAVDLNYGICKSPTTAGSSSGGNDFDIVPGDPGGSIVSFRVHSVTPGIMMPPVARSVEHVEGAALVDDWIEFIVDSRYDDWNCGAP